jgi:sugar-specific transcriptional regulator TrmB
MPNYIQDLVPLFKELGVTEYESKVYISLLRHHPASAYTISQNSDVPHSRVYDVTRRLIKRGFVASTGTKPEMFSPLSPQDLIEKIRKEYQYYTSELERRIEEIEFHSDFDPVWNTTSPGEVLAMTDDTIRKAERTVYLGIWSVELEKLEESLREAHARGVEIFLLIYGLSDMDFGHVYHHSTEKLPMYHDMGRSIDCVVDSSWCITGRFGRMHPCRVVWTKNKGLVQAIESYIRHDLYLAEINRDLNGEIEKRYGHNLNTLREKFLG